MINRYKKIFDRMASGNMVFTEASTLSETDCFEGLDQQLLQASHEEIMKFSVEVITFYRLQDEKAHYDILESFYAFLRITTEWLGVWRSIATHIAWKKPGVTHFNWRWSLIEYYATRILTKPGGMTYLHYLPEILDEQNAETLRISKDPANLQKWKGTYLQIKVDLYKLIEKCQKQS